jgi:hypothetical protein
MRLPDTHTLEKEMHVQCFNGTERLTIVNRFKILK